MKNKFEALTAFQQWPEDWQRLCAEYWAENDKPSGSVTTSLHSLWAEMHQGIKRIPHADQYVEPQAVAKIVDNVKAVEKARGRKHKFAHHQPWTVMEQEYLSKCWEESGRQRIAASKAFLEKYPGRTIDAVRRQIWNTEKADGSLVIRY